MLLIEGESSSSNHSSKGQIGRDDFGLVYRFYDSANGHDGRQGGGGEDLVGAHHFVFFVFYDVAMPHIGSCIVFEAGDDPRDISWRRLDGVFPSHRFIRELAVQVDRSGRNQLVSY